MPLIDDKESAELRYILYNSFLEKADLPPLDQQEMVLYVGSCRCPLFDYMKEEGIDVFGLDIRNPSGLEHLCQYRGNILGRTIFEDGFFSLMITLAIFDPGVYSTSPEKVEKEAYRILADNGIYLIDDVDIPDYAFPMFTEVPTEHFRMLRKED